MTIKTDLGYIDITNEVLAGIAGYAASSCFGVKGMTIRSMSDGLAHLLGLENQSRGVKVTEAVDGGVNIDLHIRSRARREYCHRLPLYHRRGTLSC